MNEYLIVGIIVVFATSLIALAVWPIVKTFKDRRKHAKRAQQIMEDFYKHNGDGV